jgi:hypothetical protein
MENLKSFFSKPAGKTILAIVILCIVFVGGMEFKAYQIRSAIGDIFSGLGSNQKESNREKDFNPASNDLNKKVTMSIEKKGFSTQSFNSANTFTFKFTNNSEKDIEGVQGLINLMDLFGNSIKQVRITYDEGIKVGESKLYSASVDYNQFMEEDIKLKSVELPKLKYEWDVNTIIYKDGSKESK